MAYQIGLTEVGMVDVTGLATYRAAPPGGSTVSPYGVYRTAASGYEYGDGRASCEWIFPSMTPAFFAAMIAYLDGAVSATVYIKTRKDDNTYDTYSAIMHRPVDGQTMNWVRGHWHDVTFRFTDMRATSATIPPIVPPTVIADGSFIRYYDGAWEVTAEPLVLAGIVLTPALEALIETEGSVYYDSTEHGIMVYTEA